MLDEGEEGSCVRLEGSRDGRSPDVCQVQGGPGGLHVTKQLCEGSLEDQLQAKARALSQESLTGLKFFRAAFTC